MVNIRPLNGGISTKPFPVGNLHLNVVADQYLPEIESALEPYVYEIVGMSTSFLHKRMVDLVTSSISTRIYLGRTWDWRHEKACTSILEKRTQHRADE